MRFKSVVLGVLLACCPALAQENHVPGGKKKASDKTFRTLAYFNTSKPLDLYYKDGEEVKELVLPRMNLSPKYEVPTDREIILGLKDSEGNFVPKYKMTFPENLKNGVLLMLTPEEGEFCKFLLLKFDLQDVDFGETLIYNSTRKYIVGKMGEQEVQVAPQKRLKVKDEDVDEKKAYTVSLKVGDGKTFRPLCRNVWVKNPNARRIGFVITDRVTKRTRILCFPELREKEKEE